MSKTRENWIKEWEAASGNDFEKSLALLRKYSGYIPRVGGGKLSLALTGRWHTHHGQVIQDAIHPLHVLSVSETSIRTIQQLYLNIFQCMTSKREKMKENGDLYHILSVIAEKTKEIFWGLELLIEPSNFLELDDEVQANNTL